MTTAKNEVFIGLKDENYYLVGQGELTSGGGVYWQVCVYLHMSGYISFNFNLIKRLHQKNKQSCLHTQRQKKKTWVFKISGQNLGVSHTDNLDF